MYKRSWPISNYQQYIFLGENKTTNTFYAKFLLNLVIGKKNQKKHSFQDVLTLNPPQASRSSNTQVIVFFLFHF